jgi:hypothetical protein
VHSIGPPVRQWIYRESDALRTSLGCCPVRRPDWPAEQSLRAHSKGLIGRPLSIPTRGPTGPQSRQEL